LEQLKASGQGDALVLIAEPPVRPIERGT